MKRSGVRAALAFVLILIIAGVAVFELNDFLATDGSSETQIRKLESYWPSRRRAAATELARFTGEADKVVPTLVKALGDSDTNVRLNALESLKSYGEKSKAAGPVARQLVTHDPDQKVRQEAAALLGLIKDQDAVPILLTALDDRDPAVRVEAIRSLGRFGRGIASGPLLDKVLSALGPEQPVEIRAASLEALDSLAQDQERSARAIAGIAAEDPSPEIRYRAVSSIKKPIFEFQVPALIAALDDPNPRVRLIAGNNLARIGMSDDRTVPALCHAALTADDDGTREGIGTNLDLLVLDSPSDKTPDELLTQRLQTAVREFQTVLETRDACAREHVLSVLGRLISLYQSSGKPSLLEPARAAVGAVLARMEDEKEAVSLRIDALNQWTAIQLGRLASSRRATSRSAPPAHDDELHATSLWIAALCKALKSPVQEVRSRAGVVLMVNVPDPDPDPSIREAWRKAVPALTEAIKNEDAQIRHGSLAILSLLGPEAGDALPALRSLAAQTQEAAIKSAAEGAIKSISSIDDLKAKDPAVRIAAALSLGRLNWRAAPALPALIGNLKDPETKVRAAAVNALKALGPVRWYRRAAPGGRVG
jgi:HEAT repeat protein